MPMYRVSQNGLDESRIETLITRLRAFADAAKYQGTDTDTLSRLYGRELHRTAKRMRAYRTHLTRTRRNS